MSNERLCLEALCLMILFVDSLSSPVETRCRLAPVAVDHIAVVEWMIRKMTQVQHDEVRTRERLTTIVVVNVRKEGDDGTAVQARSTRKKNKVSGVVGRLRIDDGREQHYQPNSSIHLGQLHSFRRPRHHHHHRRTIFLHSSSLFYV